MKVLIVDDHPFIRSSVSTQLRQDRMKGWSSTIKTFMECHPLQISIWPCRNLIVAN